MTNYYIFIGKWVSIIGGAARALRVLLAASERMGLTRKCRRKAA